MNPVETVIDAYGGNAAEVARVCGVSKQNPRQWADGRVPAKYQPVILDDATKRGIELTAEDLIYGRPA